MGKFDYFENPYSPSAGNYDAEDMEQRAMTKPTIRELEEILGDPTDRKVEMAPDGSVFVASNDVVALRAQLTARAKTMLNARNSLIMINDALEDEGDRVYFGSSNHANVFTEVVEEIDGWAWDDIMRDATAWPDYIGELRTARLQRDNLAALLRRLIYRHGKELPLEKALAGADDYLTREGLLGSPLRQEEDDA